MNIKPIGFHLNKSKTESNLAIDNKFDDPNKSQ